MRISIFGLGYVGAVTAACLARRGHRVVGVDVQRQKVEDFNRGKPPIIEPGLEEILGAARDQGLLRATQDVPDALTNSDVSIVCVGTPSSISGALDLDYVSQVTRELGNGLRSLGKAQVLVYRSTMLPGSTRALVQSSLQDLVDATQLLVLYYPEFLREGTAVQDFETPSLSVVGTPQAKDLPAELNGLFPAGTVVVEWEAAELLKYACNSFHAAKITFANEIGRVGKQLTIDGRQIMDLLCRDSRLNISPYYLRPGNPFGGSCLPKDVRALTHYARLQGLRLPMLENLLPSNEQHLQSLLLQVQSSGQDEVVLLGLSFKSNTDDLRESAMVEVAQHLLGRGYQVRIYDPQLNLAALVGSNKRVIDTRMPHLASLLKSDLPTAVGQRGLLVAAQQCVAIDELRPLITSAHRILDINGWPALRALPCPYEGLCW
jgi:GDP-mannose 6-dehydrogenase